MTKPDGTTAPVSHFTFSSLRPGYIAIVVGASGGIGSALCDNLRDDPRLGELVELSRSRDGFDITDECEVAKYAAALKAPIDLLVCATGVLTVDGTPPEKTIRQIDPHVMSAQFMTNAVGPALVAKHFLPLLSRRDRSIAAFLSARVGSIGDNKIGGWISYRASKAALNQIVKTASVEIARTHSVSSVLAIHPGTVETNLSAPYSRAHQTVHARVAAQNILRTLDEITPGRTGAFLAYDGAVVGW